LKPLPFDFDGDITFDSLFSMVYVSYSDFVLPAGWNVCAVSF
jgi:hypothetical protein